MIKKPGKRDSNETQRCWC